METEALYKSIEEIKTMCEVLVRANQEQAEIPTIPLDGLLTTLESYKRDTGIICNSKDCVFHNDWFNCGLKIAKLKQGRCLNYSPNLKPKDILNEELIFSNDQTKKVA